MGSFISRLLTKTKQGNHFQRRGAAVKDDGVVAEESQPDVFEENCFYEFEFVVETPNHFKAPTSKP